jgi:hypothetical protein
MISILNPGAKITATTTSYSQAIPLIDDLRPMFIRITSSAPAFVSVGTYAKVATTADTLVQPADELVMCVAGMNTINVVTASGTANVVIVPLANSAYLPYALTLDEQAFQVLAKYGTDSHLYLPGVGTVSGFTAGNYLDSAGTTVATVDNPVGLVLDGAGSVGAELATVSGATLTGTGSTACVSSNSATVSGKYIVKFDYNISSGSVFAQVGNFNCPTKTGAGSFYQIIDSTATGNIQIGTVSAVGTVSNFSVKEVTGIHASQATAGFKPVERRGIVNLLTWSNDLTNGAWIAQGATKSGQVLNVPNNDDQVYHSNTIPAGAYTYAAILSGSGTCKIAWGNGTDGYANTLSVTLTATPTMYVMNHTFAGANTQVNIGKYAGDTATAITFGGAGLFQGTLTASQILASGGIPLTTTAAASSSGGNYFWRFDGTDDRISLGAPLFQMSDDFAVVVGYKPSVIAGYKSPFFPASNSATFARLGAIGIDPSGQVIFYNTNDAGTFFAPQIGTTVANESFVASGVCRSNVVKGRKNAGSFSTTSTLSGAFTINAAAIGTAQGFDFANGYSGPIFAIKGNVSDADLLTLEKFVAQWMGVTL